MFVAIAICSHKQVFELMRGLDKDCDSTIDVQEFASRFEPVFTRLNLKQDVSVICLVRDPDRPSVSCPGVTLRARKYERPAAIERPVMRNKGTHFHGMHILGPFFLTPNH